MKLSETKRTENIKKKKTNSFQNDVKTKIKDFRL